jgi:hypothetical protein
MRVVQPVGTRGSLKWIQQAVNQRPASLDNLIIPSLRNVTAIHWRSPLGKDQHAEYRDAAFLQQIGASQLTTALHTFWPTRGPQWDALACCDDGSILLVEAKAHVAELCSPRCQASAASKGRISSSLAEAASFLGAQPRAPWSEAFYQLANRIAHLYFLRKCGLQAWLVLINFIGDSEMKGPSSELEWRAAYHVMWYVLGIPNRHKLSPYIIEIFPHVKSLE